jgi:LysM repeat protein
VIEKKPIRKDRVLFVALILIGAIVLPFLLRSGHSPPQSPSSEPSYLGVPLPAETALEEGTLPSPGENLPSFPEIAEPVSEEKVPSEGPPIIEYTVGERDTLSSIASVLGVRVEQLMASNRIRSPQAVQPGQILRVPQNGILHVIKKGQTLTDISLTYAVPIDELIAANKIANPELIYAGQEIVIPVRNTDLWETVMRLSMGKESRFIYPLMGEITSPFGWRVHPVLGYRQHHDGIDFDVPIGTTVHAAAMGKVYTVGEQEGYGTWVVLEHADGYYTAYGHLSKILVHTGQFVEAGQPIAESGNSGISSGPHLHFEVRNHEFPVDPLRYLP